MNNWQNDFLAEDHRQCILKEVEHIRLEKLALQSQHRPPFFARAMAGFGSWMMSTGKQLHERYEVPTAQRVR